MRMAGKIFAVLATMVGGVWMLQGLGVAGGSFMTGQMSWFWIGLVVAVVGLGGLYALSGRSR